MKTNTTLFSSDILWNFSDYLSNCAVIDDKGNSLSYGELSLEADKLADAIGGRCLIFILCKNEIGSVIGYVSAIKNKIVPMMLSSDLEKELLNNLIESYHPSYLWLPSESLTNISNPTILYSSHDYHLIATDLIQDYTLFDELAILLTTSGSTGSPKFVRQSYNNILSNTKSIVDYLKIDDGERPITTLPMNYTYGLSIINTHLYVGATILVTNYSLMQKDFWSFFKEQKATSFGGVPYTYEILNRLRFERMNLPSLRTMTQAGGKLSLELQKKFTEYALSKHINFVVMYGQCEATARMSYLPMSESTNHYGSIGVPIPGGKFSIIDLEGHEILEPGIAGELVYYGDNVTLGYALNRNDLSKGDERHGVLLTGDVARFDNDSFYYIVGRKKRFLKVFGNRLNLDEIEQMLKNQFVGEDIAASGVDDHVFIFITNATIQSDVKSFIVHKTGLNQIAFSIKIIESIPKNESGKIQYTELSKYYS